MKRPQPAAAVATLLLAMLAAADAATVGAQQSRAVVLSKATLAGKPIATAAVDSALSAALSDAGLRIVDLDAALAAQRFAFADSVQAGKVPDELTVLNADVISAYDLSCSQTSEGVMGSRIRAFECTLSTKVVRVDAGDVIFADSVAWPAHGLSAQAAVGTVVRKRLPAAVGADAGHWTARLTADGAWELDLVVTRVPDRRTARALAQGLRGAPGVLGSRLSVFNGGLTKVVVSGSGAGALETLPDALETDHRFPLTVTYQTGRVLHASYDFGKAFQRATMMMVVAPPEARAQAPDMTVAALSNLPYLRLAHTRPLLTDARAQSQMEKRLRAKARALGVPLYSVLTLARRGAVWAIAARVSNAESGAVLAGFQAEGPSLSAVVDEAVRGLDVRYRAALGRPETRLALGLEDGASRLAEGRELVVTAFHVAGASAAEGGPPMARLELENPSPHAISDLSVQLHGADARPLSAQAVPDLAPGARVVLPVPLEPSWLDADEYVQVRADIRYRLAGHYGRASASAPLLSPAPARDLERERLVGGTQAPAAYVDVIKVAVARFNEGEWEVARTLFERSHRIYPNARTLRALGMVEFDMGHYDRAAEYFRQALGEREGALTPALRIGVTRWLHEAESFTQAG